MSKDNASLRFTARNPSKNPQSEGNENEFENLSNTINFPPPRTPLNSIPDPSQYLQLKENHELDNDSKVEAVKAVRSSDGKFEGSDHHQLITLSKRAGNVGSNHENSRVSNRGKTQSEPNSSHSTPARRVSSIGAWGPSTGPRAPLYTGERGGSSSRVSRGLSVGNSEIPAEITHFELEEDPSFWNDHNVQTLIRIRPISSTEKVSQGHGRCLRQESPQSLIWLGHPELRFTFDHIACETMSQKKLFRVAGLPMVDNCMSGYNSCMFAYGQTGSGKTYTMMGDIGQMDGKLNKDCGITPRIFEYLFMRIEEEEENRRDEKLKYSCKCSFLEIYNEQITDLLEPCSTNLQLREDLKKGVYVENLMEYNVRTVSDILKLLLQGAANRKMAATNMNSESSRSHSVFTCIIESHWEKDSMTHLRFGRLNLVDLAGSERQKSSGAEGDRLKEAANINKSLSTLGLVIMSLVDVAHGKHRHVPYRDSRLTFLLQDSLGGNSKTTIIANVSPSICSASETLSTLKFAQRVDILFLCSSASETLSTLKFAQRAKLIQNNVATLNSHAKVNEDASGDVTALQRQIQQLKGQLSFIMKTRNYSRSLSHFIPSFEKSLGDFSEREDSSGESDMYDDHNIPHGQKRKMNCLEATLVGALRREKFVETEVRRLEAEVAHMNRLAQQKEEDAQHTKMMLRGYEEKIKRLELLADGLVSVDKYLMDENQALVEEIELLRARSDRNPEVTRFALENIRLLEQLRVFQNFYEQGERETVLAEVSELRDKLLETLEAQENYDQHKFLSRRQKQKLQDNSAVKELEECKNMNAKLISELEESRSKVRQFMNQDQAAVHSVTGCLHKAKDPKEPKGINKNMLVETISIRSDSGDQILSSNQQEDGVQQNKSGHEIGALLFSQSSNTLKELMDAKILMEALETEQVCLIEELQLVQEENHKLIEILSNRDKVEKEAMVTLDDSYMQRDSINQNLGLSMEGDKDISTTDLQVKLDKMTKDLEEAQLLSSQYLENHASELSKIHETGLICEEVGMETTKTILHLQEEVSALQSELQKRLCSLAEENDRLRVKVAAKEDDIREVHAEWEKASLELTSFLLDGSKSLRDASGQIKYISGSFPHVNVGIGEHVEKAAKLCVEKEETILLLEKSLEDARKTVLHMEWKLNSLKGAAMVLTEVQQIENDASTKEAVQLTMILDDTINMIEFFENKFTGKEDQVTEANKRANAAFLAMYGLADNMKVALTENAEEDSLRKETNQTIEMKHAVLLENTEIQIELARLGQLKTESAFNVSFANGEMYLSSLQTDIQKAVSLYREVIQEFVQDIHEMKKNCVKLKENCRNVKLMSESSKDENDHKMLLQIIEVLVKINDRLSTTKSYMSTIIDMYGCPAAAEALLEVDGWTSDSSTPDSNLSAESIAPRLDESSPNGCYKSPVKSTEQSLGVEFEGVLVFSSSQESELPEQFIKNVRDKKTAIFCLRKEFRMVFDAVIKLNIQLAALFNGGEIGEHSLEEGICLSQSPYLVNKKDQNVTSNGHYQFIMPKIQPSVLVTHEAKAGCCNTKEFVADGKGSQASNFCNKIEEARATMQEADVMLNTLLKANENSRQLTGMWKQAGKDLMAEKASLIEEIEQLKSSICLKDGENEILQDQIHYSFMEIANLMSLLEGSFLHMQREREEMCKAVYSDALMMGKETLRYICFSKSSLEDICAEAMEKEFASFVLHQCSAGEYFKMFRSLNKDLARHPDRYQDRLMNHLCETLINEKGISGLHGEEEEDQTAVAPRMEAVEVNPSHDNTIKENLRLKKELERKEVLLKGLLFDFSLLQESASTTKDLKVETENLIASLSQNQHKLQMKTSHLDNLLIQNRKLECRLADTESALLASNSDLEQAKGTLDIMSDQNAEFKVLLRDLYLKKSEAEEQLEEQREVVKTLENEILLMISSAEKQLFSSIEDIENDLRTVTAERDQLREQLFSLQDRLDMAYALADENEAIAVEARQESEANKMYAEQKEEEVKILEHSVEELECTINVLEKKVYEMEEEVERHRIIRDSSEIELQALRQRLLTVENFTENRDSENSTGERPAEDQLSRKLNNRSLELHETHKRIIALEKEIADQTEEINQCKKYISELVLHAEAQASQYQQKYKSLEEMVREVKTDASNLASVASTLEKMEKSSTRTRGSSSPFRCIGGLVQQMNLEKDQELSIARLRIEELESLLASRQKEVCMLNTRLAAAESMTHDVIRDLLGVKLDMTNYANLMGQYQLQKLVQEAQQQTHEFVAMEKEILNLRSQINDLIEERERFILEVNRREADIFSIQITVEQIQERDQLLTAQNEMLKVDKINLQRKVAELDDMVKKLCGAQTTQPRVQQQMNSLLRSSNIDFSKRLTNSEKQLLRVNDELSQYYKSESSHPLAKLG